MCSCALHVCVLMPLISLQNYAPENGQINSEGYPMFLLPSQKCTSQKCMRTAMFILLLCISRAATSKKKKGKKRRRKMTIIGIQMHFVDGNNILKYCNCVHVHTISSAEHCGCPGILVKYTHHIHTWICMCVLCMKCGFWYHKYYFNSHSVCVKVYGMHLSSAGYLRHCLSQVLAWGKRQDALRERERKKNEKCIAAQTPINSAALKVIITVNLEVGSSLWCCLLSQFLALGKKNWDRKKACTAAQTPINSAALNVIITANLDVGSSASRHRYPRTSVSCTNILLYLAKVKWKTATLIYKYIHWYVSIRTSISYTLYAAHMHPIGSSLNYLIYISLSLYASNNE